MEVLLQKQDNFTLKENFFLNPNRQDLEIISSIDYSSGIFITTKSTKDNTYSVTDLNILHRHVQHFESIDEKQSHYLNSELFRYYLQAYRSNDNYCHCHPVICFQNQNEAISHQIPDFIQQRINLI